MISQTNTISVYYRTVLVIAIFHALNYNSNLNRREEVCTTAGRTHARTHTSTRTHAYNKVAFTCTMSLDYFKFGHEIFAEWQTRGNHLQKENVSISIKIIRYCKRKTTFFFILENCIILMLKRKKLLPTDS